jgi:hypothetical protein
MKTLSKKLFWEWLDEPDQTKRCQIYDDNKDEIERIHRYFHRTEKEWLARKTIKIWRDHLTNEK